MLPHASITLLLIALQHKRVHLRLNEVYRLVAIEVVLNLAPKLFDLLLYPANVLVDSLKVGAELRINDVIILLRLPYIDTLF